MFASVASKIFSYFLGSYVEELGSGQLEMAILNGNTTLNDLKIKKTALLGHNIPVEVVKGCIHRIDLTIPWSSLFSKSTYFDIDEIFILGVIKSDSLLELDMDTQNIHREFDALCAQEEISKESVLSGIIGRLLNKLEATVSKIHIRIEYTNPQNGNIMALGILIPIIKATTIDCPGFYLQQDVFRKLISIHDFSIYFDTNTQTINTDDFRKQMHLQMAGQHQYILKDFSFNCIFEHSKGMDNSFLNRFQIDTPGFDIRLDEKQWENIALLKAIHLNFLRMRYYCSVGRPIGNNLKSANEIVSWWRYARRCAFKKLHPMTFDPSKALIFLRSRRDMFPFLKSYIQSKQKEKFNSKIKLHQDFFGPDVFLCLTTYAKYVINVAEAQNSRNIDITGDELKTIIREETGKTYYHIDFNFKELKVCLNTSDQTPLSSILFSSLRGILRSSENDAKTFEFKLGDIAFINNLIKTNNKIFYLDHEESNDCLSGNIKFVQAKRMLDIKINGASPHLNVDVPLVPHLISFFKGSSVFFEKIVDVKPKSRRDATRLEIDHIISSVIKKNVSLHFDASKVVIPAEKELIIFLDAIDISSTDNKKPSSDDPQTFYDGYQLKLTKFGVNVGDIEICKPFSTEVRMEQLFVPMSTIPSNKIFVRVDDVSLLISHDVILALMNLSSVFQIEDSIQVPKTKAELTEIKDDASGSNFYASLIFDKFNLVLQNEKTSKFSMEGLKSELTTLHGINFAIELQRIIGEEISNSLRFSAGSEMERALIGNISMTETTDITAQLIKPDIQMTFQYIMELMKFFDLSDETESSQSKIESNSSVFTMDINIVSPTYTIPFQAQNNQIINLIMDMSEMDVKFDSSEPEKMTIPMTNFICRCNDSHLVSSKHCIMKMEEKDLRNYFHLIFPDLSVSMDQYNYRLVMDLADYIPFVMDESRPPKETNPDDDMIIHVKSDLMSVNFLEQKQKFLNMQIKDFDYMLKDDANIVNTGVIIGKLNDEIQFANIPGVKCVYKDRITNLEFLEGATMNCRLKETNYLYVMFMDESLKLILDYDRTKIIEKTKDLPPIVTNINWPKSQIELSKNDLIYTKLEINQMDMKIELTKPDVHTIVSINGLHSTTTKLGAITDFINCPGNIYFEMVENKIIVKTTEMSMSYQQQFFLDFVHYTTGVMNERDFDPDSPIKLKLFNYSVDVEKMKILMLPRPPIGKNCGLVIDADDVKVRSQEDDLLIMNMSMKNIKGSASNGEYIFSCSDFGFPLRFGTSFDVPQLSPGYDEKMIEKYKNPPIKYLHSINITINIEKADYSYQRFSSKQMCDVFCTFLDFEKIDPEPFKLKYNIDADIDLINIAFDTISINSSVKNLKFKMRGDDQFIDIGPATMTSNTGKLLAKLEASKGNSLSMTNNKKELKINIFSVLCFFERKKMTNLLRLLYRSPFLLTKWGMSPEVPSPMIVEMNKVRLVIPVLNKGNVSLLYQGKMTSILKGDDLSFTTENGSLRILSEKCKYFPIFENFSFSFIDTVDKGLNTTKYLLGDCLFNFSVTDISSLYVFLDKIMSFVDVAMNEKQKNPPPKIDNHITEFHFGKLSFNIVKNKLDKTADVPMFKFEINPIDFVFDPKSNSQLILTTSSLDSMNLNTGLWDMLIEPISMSLISSSPDQNLLKADLNVRNFNINFAYSAIKQILSVYDEIQSNIKTKNVLMLLNRKFVIKNELGTKATFAYKSRNSQFSLESNESKEFLMDCDEDSPIFFWYSDRVVTLKSSLVNFPMFLSPYIVVIITRNASEVIVTFSSLLRVTNSTSTAVDFLLHESNAKYRRLAKINPGESKSIAWDFPETSKIAVSATQKVEKFDLVMFSNLRKQSQIITNKISGSPEQYILESNVRNYSGITDINISLMTAIINQFQETINLKIVENSQSVIIPINPGCSIDTNIIRPHRLACASLGNLPLPDDYNLINLTDGEISMIPVNIKSNTKPMNMAIYVSKEKDACKTKLTLFSPSILINHTPFKLSYSNDSYSMKNNSKTKSCYWSDTKFFNNNKEVLLNVAFENEANSQTPINCLSVGSVSPIFLPLSKTNNIFLPLSYSISSGDRNLFSSVVCFRPLLHVSNYLDFGFALEPLESIDSMTTTGHSIFIQSGSCEIVKLASQSLCYLLSAENSQEKIPITMAEPFKCVTYLKTDKNYTKIMIEVVEDNGVLKASISKATIYQSSCLSNQTPYHLKIRQHCGQIFDLINPKMSSIIAFEKPYDEHILVVQMDNFEFTVSTTQVCEPYQVRDLYVQVFARENGLTSITITNSPIERKDIKKYDLSFSISSLSASFIDMKSNEIALVNLKNLKLSAKTLKNTTALSLSLESLQIDDQNPEAYFEVACSGSQREGLNFIEICCELYNDAALFTQFESIDVRIQPINLRLDIPFIADLINFYYSFVPDHGFDFYSPKENENQNQDFIVTSKSVHIHELVMLVTVENNNTRSYSNENIPTFIKFVPRINEGEVYLPALPLNDFVSTRNFVETRVIKPYFYGAIKQVLKLILNHDIFLNIGGVTTNIAHGISQFKKSPARAVAQLTLGTAFAASEGVLSSVSHLMHTIYNAESSPQTNRGAADSVIGGISAVSNSISGAIVGVVADPIHGASQNGFGGFVTGLGNGIVGLVARPVIGLVDGAVGIVGGARKAIDGKEFPKRIRKRRVLPSTQIIPFSPELAEMHGFIKEPVIAFFNDKQRPATVVLSTTLLTIFGVQNIEKYSLQSLAAATQNGTVLEIAFRRAGTNELVKLKFETLSKDLSANIARLLTSRTNAILSGTAALL